MIELFTAKSGAPSVKVDGMAMHSPYDPAREAQRFARETLGSERPSTVIVLGECLGHVTEAIARERPAARLIAASYSAEIAQAAFLRGIPCWHPGLDVGFSDFLRLQLDELQIEGLRVIEWPPAARAFSAVSLAANEALRRVIQELNGSFVTTVAAGRIWLRNSIANFIHVEPVMKGPLCSPDRPIVIVAPGPSLEQAGPLLAALRPLFDLWALPTSCPFLADNGLHPDLVVMTDPGFYSMHHLHFAALQCPVAMPLSASRGSWCLPGNGGTGCGVYLLEQPDVFEKSLLDAAGVKAPVVPAHGTVAATAIDLAAVSTRGPVIVAGLDLAARDLLSHARPNAFDRLLHLQASRMEPHLSLTFQRAALLGAAGSAGSSVRVTAAMRTYAGWFDTGMTGGPRIHRLLPSQVPVTRMSPLDGQGLHRLLHASPMTGPARLLRADTVYPARDVRQAIAVRLLGSWGATMRAARDVGGGVRSVENLGALPLAISHFVAPRRLVDVLRKTRLGEDGAARDAAHEMLSECIQFLDHLGEKVIG
jgi:hypothetical protein